MPVYAYSDGMTKACPNLYIDVVASKPFSEIVDNDLNGVEGLQGRDFFTDWDVFAEYVHFLSFFAQMTEWKELRAQVRYCSLLAWEAKTKGLESEGIPTGHDIETTLMSMCAADDIRTESVAAGVKRKRELSRLSIPLPKRLRLIIPQPRRHTQIVSEVAREADTGEQSENADDPMAEQASRVDETRTPTTTQGTRTRMSLQEWSQRRKKQNQTGCVSAEGVPGADTATSDQASAASPLEIPPVRETTQAFPPIPPTVRLTTAQREDRRTWSSILARDINHGLNRIREMEAENVSRRDRMQQLLSADGPQNGEFQKLAAEAEDARRGIQEERMKVQKRTGDKEKVDEQLKGVVEAGK